VLQVSLIAPHLAWRRQALLLQEGAAAANLKKNTGQKLKNRSCSLNMLESQSIPITVTTCNHHIIMTFEVFMWLRFTLPHCWDAKKVVTWRKSWTYPQGW
jgi:hypothetical protein